MSGVDWREGGTIGRKTRCGTTGELRSEKGNQQGRDEGLGRGGGKHRGESRHYWVEKMA